MAYVVTTFDLCIQGFERLRSRSEFILCAYPSGASTVADVCDEWLSDIQSCERFDGFDYDAAERVVKLYAQENAGSIERALSSVEWPDDDAEDYDAGESVVAFLYIETGDERA